MEALGPLVGFFTHKVEEKISFLRQLSQEESLSAPPLSKGHAYHSVHSMLEAELQRGVVSFTEPLPSGSRLFLRLHRSMRFVMLLLEKLWSEPEERSLVELCREAYEEVLAPHHPWLLQRAAQVAFAALPDRSVFLPLLCVRGMKEAEPVMRTVITVMEEIQRRSQRELESRGMMDLP
ncbi:hypothetical protein DNTS_027662 [Danionella cerebrum]|uniref:Glycolipid transfer protein domain-containing protein n=1 Tax=Danionella cerebrum TaxID=2873325 RepID=A0A553NH41_9TELE|nr:hypothetical protein DNTS_027662 [Danionella translucida]